MCEVEVQNFSRRHINAVIHNCDMDMDWKFTGFYGHPDATKRLEAWNLLKRLEQLTPGPWACVGDFNEVVTLSEKLGGITLTHRGGRTLSLADVHFCL
jgi:hypothetical protein